MHSFLKWTVGEKITNRLFTEPVTVSHKCKIIDKLQQTEKTTSHKITRQCSCKTVEFAFCWCFAVFLNRFTRIRTCVITFIIQYCQ